MGTGLAGLMGEGREGQEFGKNWQRHEGEKKTLAQANEREEQVLYCAAQSAAHGDDG
jgi:hypothetical protein